MRKKTRNILIIVIAAVLVLAIGGGTTVWYFLSDDDSIVTEAKKKKKKKKKKKTTSSTSSEENPNYDGDDYVFDPDDWDPGLVSDDEEEENSSDETESQSPYEVDLDYVEPLPANQQIAFQAYHYEMDGWDEVTGESQYKVFNYYYCSDIVTLKKIKEAGCMAWLGIGNPFGGDYENTEIPEQWIENKKVMVDAIKAAGLWDAVAGFHGEELMLGMSGEQFRIITKYLSDTYPGKRIYCVLSLYEIDGAAPDRMVDPMTYRTYGYVTDIGYDWYDSNDYNKHREYVMKMLEGVGRKNVRIWLFPTTYRRFNQRTAEYCCESLDMCYRLLMDLKDEGYIPGGLDCYTWGSFGGEDGMGRLLDKEIWGDEYDLLRDKMREIGQKILNDSYRYKEIMN